MKVKNEMKEETQSDDTNCVSTRVRPNINCYEIRTWVQLETEYWQIVIGGVSANILGFTYFGKFII